MAKEKNRVLSKSSNVISKKIISKANLKRGKLPSNWNSYVETHGITKTNEKIAQKYSKESNTSAENDKSGNKMMKENNLTGKCIAMDCEMVGINKNGRDHMLARVSIVDENGKVLYDTFVKPTQRVVDYRTEVSGVRPKDLIDARDFKTVQEEVNNILHGKVLVGHALRNDLKVLYLKHNKKYIRDTSKFKKFREETNGMTPSLKSLSSKYLKMEIQNGEHSSVEDARAAMLLYIKFKDTWENEFITRKYKR